MRMPRAIPSGPTRTSAKTTSFVIRCGRGRCKSGNRCRQLHADNLHRFSATELIAIHQASESVPYPTTPVDRVERRLWKIERLFAWLRNFRRLVVRYGRYAENFLGILYLGCCVILLRHRCMRSLLVLSACTTRVRRCALV